MMLQVFVVMISLLSICVVLAPLLLARKGHLQAAQSFNDMAKLESLKAEILKSYLVDEKSFLKKELSSFVWQKRRLFWVNRYTDVARRIDFLRIDSHGQG